MSDNFCVNPWVSAHIRLDQGYNPCCLFSKTYKANNIADYANGTELAELKQRILTGERVKECNYCWLQEDQGYISKRQRDNQTYQKVFLHKFKNRELEPSASFNEYYIRLGNHCNLRCTTCSEEFSTGWISEYKKFGVQRGKTVLLDPTDPVWQHIKDNSRSVAVIQFIGGEPFMMSTNEQCDLLKYLVESGDASHIRLKYISNLTRLPDEQIPYWSKFKAVEMNVSMDGIGDRFEYLRFPAKWSDIDKNLKFYKDLQASAVPQLELTIMHTLSLFNIGYVKEMLDYADLQNLPIFLNLLEFPKHYNFFESSTGVKQWIRSQIQNIDHTVIKNIYNNILLHQSTTDNKTLLETISTLDHRRDLNIAKTFPELYNSIVNDKP